MIGQGKLEMINSRKLIHAQSYSHTSHWGGGGGGGKKNFLPRSIINFLIFRKDGK